MVSAVAAEIESAVYSSTNPRYSNRLLFATARAISATPSSDSGLDDSLREGSRATGTVHVDAGAAADVMS